MVLRADPPVVLDDAALQALAARYGIRELALFGSVLRDDFRPDSDVDCLITFQPASPVVDLLDFIAVKQDLEALLRRPVDLVESHLLHPLIRDEVLAEKRVIYIAPS
jgi:hypothetical protein